MSVLATSDFFDSVKTWFASTLPEMMSQNVGILFAVIGVIVVIIALVIVAIAVPVSKSRAKHRKKAAVSVAAQSEESQPVQEPAEAEAEAEEEVIPTVNEVIGAGPAEEAEHIVQESAEPEAEEEVIPTVKEVIESEPAEEVAATDVRESPAKDTSEAALWKEVLSEVFSAAPVNEQPSVAEGIHPVEQPVKEDLAPAGATVRVVEGEGWYVRTLYNRSFMAKLIQSDQTVKDFYSVLKNELLAYDTVPRISWRHESFRIGKNMRAKFVIRGKTLCLCLALDAKDYAESKYIVDDMSKLTSYAATPLLYRIKNARRCRYAAELIAAQFGAENRIEREEENFADIPYRDTRSLVEEGLIKIVRTERVRLTEGQVPVEEVFVTDEEDEEFEYDIDEMDEVDAASVSSLMGDEYAKSLLAESSEYSDKTRPCIVNLEVLGRFFEEGETVTLKELKKRVPIIDRRATYVKVLARGKLAKALVVIADDFSLEAVKMISLTGGRAVRKKKK